MIVLRLALLCVVGLLPVRAQMQYAFGDSQAAEDLNAFWYNVPRDSANLKSIGKTMQFQSSLEIYGRAHADSFVVQAEVFLHDGKKIFSRVFPVAGQISAADYKVTRSGDFFKLVHMVDVLPEPPAKIAVLLQSGQVKRTKEIPCRYHTLSGSITDFDGKPFRGFVALSPDDFSFTTGAWSDAAGKYRLLLPERTYNNIAVDDESYRELTAEAWGWHIIVDADQTLDFKVGTGEVYNLNVWSNNGGAKTYFLSFRPMSIQLFRTMGKRATVTVEGKEYTLVEVVPELEEKDISITFNGKPARILSLQRYYEIGPGVAMRAYILQVSKEGLDRVGKQTVRLEYHREDDVGGKKVVHNSVGYFQFRPNFTGLSLYY
jgi:hypothetical protein